MSASTALLAFHGAVEVVAGTRMIMWPGEVFACLQPAPETQFVGRAFGMSLVALGISAFAACLSGPSGKRGASLGALCYNLLIGVVFCYQCTEGILMHNSLEATFMIAVYHVLVAVLFLAGSLWPLGGPEPSVLKAKAE